MDLESRVFIVQDQYMRHPETDALVSKFDFTEAKKFGTLEFLLEPNSNPFPPNDAVIGTLTDKLHDFGPNDYLLLTGNPILIGWATTLATQANKGHIRMLQWNGRRHCYLEVKANLYKFL